MGLVILLDERSHPAGIVLVHLLETRHRILICLLSSNRLRPTDFQTLTYIIFVSGVNDLGLLDCHVHHVELLGVKTTLLGLEILVSLCGESDIVILFRAHATS